MTNAFCSLDDVNVRDQRVLLRVDLNVPLEAGKVADVTRLERVVPTITELANQGGKVILLSHLGRPKGPDPKLSLQPVAAALAQLMNRPIAFAHECIGPEAEAAVAALGAGAIVCLENTRFHQGEESNDPRFVAALASLGDLFVNDAFSAAHRAHASTEGLGHKLPAYAGRAMQAELHALARALEQPQHPLMAIIGGAKISTKLDLLGNLVEKVDVLTVGGAMANTFLAAQGKFIGTSLVERDRISTAQEIAAAAARNGHELLLPVDVVVAPKLEPHAASRIVDVERVGANEMILDLGPRSVEHVISRLGRTKTLVWNGPLGAFEIQPFDNATIQIAKAVAELTEAGKLLSVAGGGDTVAALNEAGVTARLSYVSTAGGAFLEWLEGRPLPGVEILKRARARCSSRCS
jgi:phosphoglycerate kinase